MRQSTSLTGSVRSFIGLSVCWSCIHSTFHTSQLIGLLDLVPLVDLTYEQFNFAKVTNFCQITLIVARLGRSAEEYYLHCSRNDLTWDYFRFAQLWDEETPEVHWTRLVTRQDSCGGLGRGSNKKPFAFLKMLPTKHVTHKALDHYGMRFNFHSSFFQSEDFNYLKHSLKSLQAFETAAYMVSI